MSAFKDKCSCFFDEADTGGDGCLERLELAKILQKCGCKKSPEEIVDWFDDLDANNDDKISKEEFMRALVDKVPHRELTDMELRQVFQAIDTDNTGFISREELLTALGERDIDWKPDDMEDNISYEDFLDNLKACNTK